MGAGFFSFSCDAQGIQRAAGRGSGRLGAEAASFLSKFPVKVEPDVVSGRPTQATIDKILNDPSFADLSIFARKMGFAA